MKLISGFFYHIGRFCLLLMGMFRSMERPGVYYHLTLSSLVSMVVGSTMILTVISLFIGGVTTLQTAYQLTSPLIPNSIIGTIVSVTALLELAPTVLTFILAGRIGSQIASEIGTMRVREQIDALEVMGVNSAAYLILPKILAGLLAIPILVTLSAFLIHLGGITAGSISGAVTAAEFTNGLREYYDSYQIVVMYVKALSFGFLITAVSAYQGYYTSGGALEVGTSATRAVVFSCLSMVVADYAIAQVML